MSLSTARLLGHYRRSDGSSDTFWAMSVPCKESVMRSPRGSKARLPSRFVVLLNGRWRRVYLNTTEPGRHDTFIGRQVEIGERIRVDYLPGA